MKLFSQAKNKIPNQTCEQCKNVYQLDTEDLTIGVFGMDDKEFVCWTCPNCKWDNRPSSIQGYMYQVAARLDAKEVHPPSQPPSYDSVVNE